MGHHYRSMRQSPATKTPLYISKAGRVTPNYLAGIHTYTAIYLVPGYALTFAITFAVIYLHLPLFLLRLLWTSISYQDNHRLRGSWG